MTEGFGKVTALVLKMCGACVDNFIISIIGSYSEQIKLLIPNTDYRDGKLAKRVWLAQQEFYRESYLLHAGGVAVHYGKIMILSDF